VKVSKDVKPSRRYWIPEDVEPGRRYWMGKVNSTGLLTPKPVRLYYDQVFGNYWASMGPGDHAEGYNGPGVTRGPFGRWTSFVSEDRELVRTWLRTRKFDVV
jgi:hypothetical protein